MSCVFGGTSDPRVFAALVGDDGGVEPVMCRVVALPETRASVPPPLGTDSGVGWCNFRPDALMVESMVAAKDLCDRVLVGRGSALGYTVEMIAPTAGWRWPMVAALGTVGICASTVIASASAVFMRPEPFVVPFGGWTALGICWLIVVIGVVNSFSWKHLRRAALRSSEWTAFRERVRASRPDFFLGNDSNNRVLVGDSAGVAFLCALATERAKHQPAAFGWQRTLIEGQSRLMVCMAIESSVTGTFKNVESVRDKVASVITYNDEHPDAGVTHAVFHSDDMSKVSAAWQAATGRTLAPVLRREGHYVADDSGAMTFLFCKDIRQLLRVLQDGSRGAAAVRVIAPMVLVCLCVLFTIAFPPAVGPAISKGCRSRVAEPIRDTVVVQTVGAETALCTISIDEIGFRGPVEVAVETSGGAASAGTAPASRPVVRLPEASPVPDRPVITYQRALSIEFTPATASGDEVHLAAVIVRNRGGKSASIQFVFTKIGL